MLPKLKIGLTAFGEKNKQTNKRTNERTNEPQKRKQKQTNNIERRFPVLSQL